MLRNLAGILCLCAMPAGICLGLAFPVWGIALAIGGLFGIGMLAPKTQGS